MKSRVAQWPGSICALLLLGTWISRAPAEVELIGVARMPGDAGDASGLTETLAEGIPHDRLGGISAIEYTGSGEEYWLLADRGPLDGATNYTCRFHRAELQVHPEKTPPVGLRLVSTTPLRDLDGGRLVGSASAFESDDPNAGARFDPEGMRVGSAGALYVSDEYGPRLLEFAPDGRESRALKVPTHFQARHPAATLEEEAAKNQSGRQTNGGLEGLAITPDGKKLLCAMQRPLVQDSVPGRKLSRRFGHNDRLLEVDLADGATREYVYVLDDPGNGVSEILAVNGHEFLVLERDGEAGTDAKYKRIYKIDLTGASDVSGCAALPVRELPREISPVVKSLFIDLLDPKFGMSGESAREKIEGLAFGPDLSDGRLLLVVAIDNDFKVELPISFCALAIDRADLPRFRRIGTAGE